jgi:hypothetical protein
MAKLVHVELPSGQIIWAHVTRDGPADVRLSKALQKLSINDLRDTIEGVVQTFATALEGLAPTEVKLEFGLQLALKTGRLTSVLAEAAGTGSVRVSVSWAVGRPAVADAPTG